MKTEVKRGHIMKTIPLPYGKGTISLSLEENRMIDVLTSRITSYTPDASQEELVIRAMAEPIGSPALRELAKDKNNIVLIASDHTRPVPSKVIVPQMLKEIREGNPAAKVTILIATGCHRETTVEELREKFGDEILEKEHIVIHDCDTKAITDFGLLPSGGPLLINSIAAEADLLVAEGFIEPHFFAGFSGGRKSVLPGVAARKVVLANHNGRFIADPNSRTGNLKDNPIHRDMIYAAKKAGLAYIVNVVLNEKHEVIYAAAGDAKKAHEAGCAFLSGYCGVQPQAETDIVITTNGGYPLDQNIYQSVKGMTAAEQAVRKGGVIIMCSKCDDGHGGKVFYETFRNEKDLNRMMDTFIRTPPEETIIDQWQSQIFARVLLKASVIFVSDVNDALVEDMHMIPAHTLQEALEKAEKIVGSDDASVTVIPDGVGVIVEPPKSVQ